MEGLKSLKYNSTFLQVDQRMSLNVRGGKDSKNGFLSRLQGILSFEEEPQGPFWGRSWGMLIGREPGLSDSPRNKPE